MSKVILADKTVVEIGRTVMIDKVEYTIVGISCDAVVFANLKARNTQEARVLEYTDNEIKELIELGIIQGYSL